MNISQIGVLGRTYRHAVRYRQIISILFKYGFGDLVDTLNIENYIEIGAQLIRREKKPEIEPLTRAERVRLALEELGPTFVKLGQVLSVQRDLLPREFIGELEKLQDRVPSFPFEEVKRIIEDDLEQPLEEVFERFDEEPLAAASIGQVHRARLKSLEEAVVKIRRPGIQKTIEVDLEIMLHVATLMERHLEGWEASQPVRVVEEFGETIAREIDYTIEASNMGRFATQFANEKSLHVPRVFRDACSDRVLTMEFIEGVKPGSIEPLVEMGLDPVQVARRGFQLMVRQVFDHGFFHADPHPGNLRILPGNKICYLDYGMMGFLSRRQREDFAELVVAIATRDEVKASRAFVRLTDWEDEPDLEDLGKALDRFMNKHFHKSLKHLDLGDLLTELVDIVAEFHMRLPQDLLLVVKTLSTAEGIGRMLDPSFDPIGLAAPEVERIQRRRYDPRRIASDMSQTTAELFHVAGEIPRYVRTLIRQVQNGQINIDIHHKGLESLENALDHVVNRLSLAILTASLVIGSSIIVLANTPPRFHDIPVLGIVGYLFAGLISVMLILGILRSGRR